MATPVPKATGHPAPDAGVAPLPAPPRTLRERDIEVLKLKQAFHVVSRGIERRQKMRRLWLRLKGWLLKLVAIFALGWAGAFAWSLHSGWPTATVLKHVASLPNCAAAYSTGLAPARRGTPGYWGHLDADNDGIACETRTASRFRMPRISVNW